METLQNESAETLRIKMFGSFALSKGDQDLTAALKNNRNLCVLMQYLLVQRGKTVSPEELTDVLWDQKDIENPSKVLQNLVYRLRKFLDTGEPSHVLHSGNGYIWNADSNYTLDLEDFEKKVSEGLSTVTGTVQDHEALNKAIQLYIGDFLEDMSYDLWTVRIRQWYKNRYSSCINALFDEMRDQGKYGDIIALCDKALSVDPYDEKVHGVYIEALAKEGRMAHAIMHYNYITDFLEKSLGVEPSPELVNIYKRLKETSRFGENFSAIMDDLKEIDDGEPGPFLCSEDMFKRVYQLEVRRMQRNGQSNCLLVFSFHKPDNTTPTKDVLKGAQDVFKPIIMNSLRRGDVVCMRNNFEVLAFLSSTSYEGAIVVAQRLQKRFEKGYAGVPVKIQYRVSLAWSVKEGAN